MIYHQHIEDGGVLSRARMGCYVWVSIREELDFKFSPFSSCPALSLCGNRVQTRLAARDLALQPRVRVCQPAFFVVGMTEYRDWFVSFVLPLLPTVIIIVIVTVLLLPLLLLPRIVV